MPLDLDKLRREVERISRPRSAVITPTPGGPAAEVRVGDEVEFVYLGRARRIRVLAITGTVVRGWDLDKSAIRSFRLDTFGRETPRETDEAASG